MTKLKTLKDIKNVSSKELRKEAAKWIEVLKENLCESSEYCDHCIDIQGTIEWIDKFFNLTKEELERLK